MTDFTTIEASRPTPPVMLVTLNRPRSLNSYTPTMCRELLQVLATFDADDELRVLLLTGAGRAFCSGADIRTDEFAPALDRPLGRSRELAEDAQAVVLALRRLDKPTVALVNGAAVAGGLAFALSCDIRLATPDARFGETSGKYGLLPDEGLAWMLAHTVGHQQTALMMWTDLLLDAQQALASGLIARMVANTALLEEGLELATRIASRAPLSQRVSKRLLRDSEEQTLAQALTAAGGATDVVNVERETQKLLASLRSDSEKSTDE